MMSRRTALQALGALSGGMVGLLSSAPAHAARTYEVTHSDAEWQKLLRPDQYRVLRKAGTDRKSTRLNSSHIQKSRMPSSA